MSTITKERLRERAREKVKSLEFAVTQTAFADTRAELEEELELARIALASLEAEPVGYFVRFDADDEDLIDQCSYNISGAFPLYSAPPAPVSAPYLLEQFAEFMAAESIKSGDYPDGWQCKASNAAHEYAQNIRAAMLQGAEPVTTSYKLPDDFDFDRFNDVVWLQAVASNPHMHSLTTSTIAIVALELNRKLADCNSPVIPDGWKLVPVEPTMEMLDEFDSIIDHGAEDSKEAWSRLIAAAPQQEVKP